MTDPLRIALILRGGCFHFLRLLDVRIIIPYIFSRNNV